MISKARGDTIVDKVNREIKNKTVLELQWATTYSHYEIGLPDLHKGEQLARHSTEKLFKSVRIILHLD